MIMKNITAETLYLKMPTGRGGEVESLTVGPGETCEVADAYVGMAKRRGLADAAAPVVEPLFPAAKEAKEEAKEAKREAKATPMPEAEPEVEPFAGAPGGRGRGKGA